MKKPHGILFVSLLIVFPVLTAVGLTLQSASIDELVSESAVIVSGIVQESGSRWNTSRSIILTDAIFHVEDVLKGSLEVSEIIVRQLGGQVGTEGMEIGGVSRLSIGERYVLFLRPGEEDDVYQIHSFVLGKFSVVSDAAGNQMVRTAFNGVVFQGEATQDIRSFDETGYSEFVTTVRQIVANEENGGGTQ